MNLCIARGIRLAGNYSHSIGELLGPDRHSPAPMPDA
jgi:hypothetical protein